MHPCRQSEVPTPRAKGSILFIYCRTLKKFDQTNKLLLIPTSRAPCNGEQLPLDALEYTMVIGRWNDFTIAIKVWKYK